MPSSSTTTLADNEDRVFEITHPFHPRFGQRFVLLDERDTWGETRVYAEDEHGALTAFPIDWTSRCAQDPTRVLGEGKAHFRLHDLLQVAQLLADIEGQDRGGDA